MSYRRLFSLVALLILLRPAVLFAAGEPSATIRVGDSIATATEIMRCQGIQFVEGGLAVTNTDDNASYLLCQFDKERTSVVLSFSKSTRIIQGISVIVFPGQKHTRTDEVWLRAKSVTPGANGAYTIEFLPHDADNVRRGARNVVP